MANPLLNAFSLVTAALNRMLAWLDSCVHYTSGYILYYLFRGLKPQTHTRPRKISEGRFYAPAVVITGASEGIGLATARHLASQGYTVFATAQDEAELSKIQTAAYEQAHPRHDQEGTAGGGGSVHPALMDVLSADSISHCAAHVESALAGDPDRPLVGVVNNAGYCVIAPMELTPDADVRRIFELDFWAYVSVVRAFLPLVKRNKGRFVSVGSYGGFVNPPLWAPYSAVKAALEGMTRAWRLELMPFGVGRCTSEQFCVVATLG
ncbi:NAD(P)-binding protein [Parathielavia hyrcaniae]|uniref:NAD(P)-binding protein n=1 Tax=Parathielavia hyrcaniae TaxID=113614 RepID=A0AAN6PXJ9_9PEZI|nr:NAD(P)-binding protein [Parathielavia hyrcaniae]